MNYFKKHLGDYAKKAGRLSMLQHGSYTLLMDACYDREQFPTMEEAIEWTWASSSAEVEAVEFVLKKFFTLQDGVYVQSRIQEEIAEYHAKAETNKRIALEREANRRAKSTNRAQDVDEAPPNHKPITTNHKPVEEQTTCAAAPAAVVEVAPALPAEPAEPPAYTLPTNTGEEYPIARQRVEEFVELYPGVDVMQELRKMRGWLISNPAKRKTKKGMMSFVNNWLSKQQNAAGSQQQLRRIGPASGRPSINNIGVAPGADDDIFNQMRTEL
jgi:uncharacterized protein YdaU (DUF1376 family)